MVGLHRGTKFFVTLWLMGEKFLKHILAYLYIIKYNEINIGYSDVQKHVSYTGSHKRFLMEHRLCLDFSESMHFNLCFMVYFYFTKF